MLFCHFDLCLLVFRAWHRYTRERKQHKREVMTRILHRMEYSQQWCAWRVWKQYVEHTQIQAMRGSFEHRYHDEVGKLKASLLDQKRKRVIALIQRWHATTLVPVFRTW